MSIIINSSATSHYGLTQRSTGLSAQPGLTQKPQRRLLMTQATARKDAAKPVKTKSAESIQKSNLTRQQQAMEFLTQKVLEFCTVNSSVPLPLKKEETSAFIKKIQPQLDVKLHKDPIKAQTQLYLAGNALIGKFRALEDKHTQPIALAIYRDGDEFLQNIDLPEAVLMKQAQHPVTHVAYGETVLRCDLPRGTPPGFGLKLLEPGWVFGASALDPFYAKGQPEKASLKSFVNNLLKNFQRPPKDSIEFDRDDYNDIQMNAHSIPLALKAKDDLERTSYGVQLFKMMGDISKALKKHAPRANAEEAQSACQLGFVTRNKKTNQLAFHNITPEYRRLFQD